MCTDVLMNDYVGRGKETFTYMYKECKHYSFLKRKLRSANLLLVALLLIVLPQSELFSAVKSYARIPQRHVFFGINPFILHWFPPLSLAHIPLPVLEVEQIFEISFRSFCFFKNVRFVIFHPKQALPPDPVSNCVTFRKKLRTYEMLPKRSRSSTYFN